MGGQIHIRIKSREDLTRAAEHYHDAVFAPEDARHNATTSTFSLTLWRETEGHVVRSRLPLLKRRVDHWARSVLTFKDCLRADIQVRDPGVWPLLNLVDYDPATGKIHFEIDGPMEITLYVSSLDGMLEDTGEVASEPGGHAA